jgi:hypothetical protein
MGTSKSVCCVYMGTYRPQAGALTADATGGRYPQTGVVQCCVISARAGKTAVLRDLGKSGQNLLILKERAPCSPVVAPGFPEGIPFSGSFGNSESVLGKPHPTRSGKR